MMILFLLTSLLGVMVLSLVVVWPWLKPAAVQGDLVALNVEVFRQRLHELEADRESQTIDEPSYLEQKLELERQLLAIDQQHTQASGRVQRKTVVFVLLWLPILSFLAYGLWGDRQAVFSYWHAIDTQYDDATRLMQGQALSAQQSKNQDGVGLLQALQTYVYRHPSDANHWVVLSEAYTAAEAINPAIEALARAHRLAPDDDQIGMTYAQMRFFSQEGQLDPESRQIVMQVLAKNSDHEGALMLLSMAAYRGQSYGEAIDWLNRLKALRLARGDAANSNTIAQLDQAITQAKQGQDALNQGVDVQVSLSAALRDQIKPDDLLFVYAKALSGPPMPYAVQRVPASVLLDNPTTTLRLSDAQAMMPSRTLSAARQQGVALVIGARVSHSGNPVGEVGDLESLPVPWQAQKQLNVVIDQIR